MFIFYSIIVFDKQKHYLSNLALTVQLVLTKPGAYFNAMINRARVGELKLHQSVMGHLKREFGNDEAPDNDSFYSKK